MSLLSNIELPHFAEDLNNDDDQNDKLNANISISLNSVTDSDIKSLHFTVKDRNLTLLSRNTEILVKEQKAFSRLKSIHKPAEDDDNEIGANEENGTTSFVEFYFDWERVPKLNFDNNFIGEKIQENQIRWNRAIAGKNTVNAYIGIKYRKKGIFQLRKKENFSSILALMFSDIALYLLDLFDDSIDRHRDVVKQLRMTKYFHSRAIDVLGSFTLICILSPRLPRTGSFKNPKKSIYLNENDDFVITADRKFASNGTKNVIFVNCWDILPKLNTCEIIQIDSIHLVIRKIDYNSILCKVNIGGRLRPYRQVIFPVGTDKTKITYEEIEDIIFAKQSLITGLILTSGLSETYFESIKKATEENSFQNCKLFIKVILDKFPDDYDKAKWLSENYYGLLMILTEKPPHLKKIIIISDLGKYLMDQFFFKKKPIIFGGFFASSNNDSDQTVVVSRDSHKYVFFYPDKYLLTSREQSIYSYMNSYELFLSEHDMSLQEHSLNYCVNFIDESTTDSDTFAQLVVRKAYSCGASAIIVSSVSGRMAIKLAHFRPNCAVVCLTDNIHVVKYIGFYHNIWIAFYNNTDKRKNRQITNYKKLVYGVLYGKDNHLINQSDIVVYVFRDEATVGYPNKFLTLRASSLVMKNL